MATKKNIIAMNNEDIPAQLETLRTDMAVLTEMIKTQASAKVTEKASNVKQIANEKTEEAKLRYDEITSKAESSIKENPLSAIAIAVGAGMLLGALTRR